MKTIIQSTEIAYNAITIQDAIQMLPLMDWLQSQAIKEQVIKEYEALSKEDKVHYEWVSSPDIKNATAQFELLLSLGFCPSVDKSLYGHLDEYKKSE